MPLMSEKQAKQCALRIQRTRRQLGLSGTQFAQISDIPLNTLRKWESLSAASLTEMGADRLAQAFKQCGMLCSAEWLLFGHGAEPTRIDTTRSDQLNPQQEAQTFHQRHADKAVILKISDPAMLPFYAPDDYVGGMWITAQSPLLTTPHHCIVRLPKQGLICRRMTISDGQIHLLPTHTDSLVAPISCRDITQAAPVIRHWKPAIIGA